ncbi:MAG TPA: hypothetical protein VF177_12975 [Anaerolineae bacterium]
MGKTQLALEYCYRHKDGYDVIWWLRADETATLAADLIELGRALGLPVKGISEQSAAVTVVRRWLEGRERRWLLVCDNADMVKPDDLRPYLPKDGPGHVLITSRNPVWGRLARVLAVGVFTADEAIDFLLERTGREERKEAAALAEALGYLPLALEHAGAYVEETGITLTEYQQRFEQRRPALWQRVSAPGDYHATITTTWELAFQRLRTDSPAAVALFDLCCFLAEEIPLDLIAEGQQAESMPQELAATVADPLALDEAIAALRRYSLLQREGDTLSIHRLVQAVTRDRRAKRESGRGWRQR